MAAGCAFGLEVSARRAGVEHFADRETANHELVRLD
jgi:hypothetical protein